MSSHHFLIAGPLSRLGESPTSWIAFPEWPPTEACHSSPQKALQQHRCQDLTPVQPNTSNTHLCMPVCCCWLLGNSRKCAAFDPCGRVPEGPPSSPDGSTESWFYHFGLSLHHEAESPCHQQKLLPSCREPPDTFWRICEAYMQTWSDCPTLGQQRANPAHSSWEGIYSCLCEAKHGCPCPAHREHSKSKGLVSSDCGLHLYEKKLE